MPFRSSGSPARPRTACSSRCPQSVFEHSVTHPEMSDPYTFDTWLGIYARHIPDHVDQMRRAYEAFKKN